MRDKHKVIMVFIYVMLTLVVNFILVIKYIFPDIILMLSSLLIGEGEFHRSSINVIVITLIGLALLISDAFACNYILEKRRVGINKKEC